MMTKVAMTYDDNMGKGGCGNSDNDGGKGKGGHPGKCGNHDNKGKGDKGDNYDERYSLIPFVAFALHRIMGVLCSGKGNGKGKGVFGKGQQH
jgi:hypothetical protein